MSNNLTPDDLGNEPQEEQDQAEPEAAAGEEVQFTEEEAQRAMAVLQQEQNLVMGSIYGLIAALVGAGVWAGVTVVTEYQIGWVAVGVGFLVGIAVRAGGKGIDQVFGIVGAVMSLIGCAVGNLFTMLWFIAKEFGLSMNEVLAELDMSVVIELMTSTFQVMDLLFYGLALYFGYRFAFRQVTLDDLNRALGRAM